ncbi:hypothetical protein D3C72_1606270 [compost metagenome]
MPGKDGFQLLLRGIDLLQLVQAGGQGVAVVVVVRFQFQGPGEGQQGVFVLAVAQQPAPQFVLQEGRVGALLQRFSQHLA